MQGYLKDWNLKENSDMEIQLIRVQKIQIFNALIMDYITIIVGLGTSEDL